MLALLIEDVTLIKQHQITAAVRYRGGATTTLTLPRPLTAQQLRATHPDVREQINVLLDDYSDAQVAHILNERGLHTGAGEAFDAVAVQWVRFTAKLPSLKQRLITAGMLTTRQLGELLGVKRSTIRRWHAQGLVEARICNELGEWLYWPPKQIPPMSRKTAHPHPQPRPQRQWVDPLYEVQCERRSFAQDVLVCPCGGRRSVVAFVAHAGHAHSLLVALGLPAAPTTFAPARDPPQAEFAWDDPA